MIYWNLKTCLILRVAMQEVLMEIAESAGDDAQWSEDTT